MTSQHKKDGNCRFKASKPLSASPGYYYWSFKKGDPRAKLYSKEYIIVAYRTVRKFIDLSRRLMDLFESGLMRFWAKTVVPMADKCLTTKKRRTSSRQVPIYLVDLTSAFLILGVGLGLAILTFLLEHIYSRILAHA